MASPWSVKRPRIVLLGDSLTENGFSVGGWAARLAERYSRKADVINRGFCGYNSSWALHVLDEAFGECSKANTALVVVFFGANDAAMPLAEGGHPMYAHQHVPVEQYGRNLEHIIEAVKSRGLHNILLVTAPPVNELGKNPFSEAGWGRSTAYAKQYAEACKRVAADAGLPVVDLWSSMQAVEGWGTSLLSDGLHFSPEGNQHLFEAIVSSVSTTWPHLRSEALPLQFPAWDAVDAGNPASSFKVGG